MKITKREILASVSIVAVLLFVGILISQKISEYQTDKNEIYNKAVKIESSDLFQYGLDTDVGNAFVYGELKAVDTVTYPEISGEYMYVSKVKEHYTRHTREVEHTRTVNGKSQTYYTTEVYYTWDKVDSDSKTCKYITLCNVEFSSSKIRFPDARHIDTLYETSKDRWKYYGTDAEHKGTIFAQLKDHTIQEKTKFYENKSIEETAETLSKEGMIFNILFWVFWIALIIGIVCGFYYLDNEWLN